MVMKKERPSGALFSNAGQRPERLVRLDNKQRRVADGSNTCGG